MSPHTKTARAAADVAYEKTQTQAREREKARAEREAKTSEVDDKTARLKAQRLARDAAGPKQ